MQSLKNKYSSKHEHNRPRVVIYAILILFIINCNSCARSNPSVKYSLRCQLNRIAAEYSAIDSKLSSKEYSYRDLFSDSFVDNLQMSEQAGTVTIAMDNLPITKSNAIVQENIDDIYWLYTHKPYSDQQLSVSFLILCNVLYDIIAYGVKLYPNDVQASVRQILISTNPAISITIVENGSAETIVSKQKPTSIFVYLLLTNKQKYLCIVSHGWSYVQEIKEPL